MSNTVKPCIFCSNEVHKFDAIFVDEDNNQRIWQEIEQEGWCHEECFDEFEYIMK